MQGKILINAIIHSFLSQEFIFSSSSCNSRSKSIFFLLIAPFIAFMSFIFYSYYDIYCILDTLLLVCIICWPLLD